MRLYTWPKAPNPQRVELFAAYKGVNIERVEIDLMAKRQFDDSYRRINPSCTVPALVLDDGTVLSEVIAICAYLEEQFPERPLMGTDARERALVLNWDHRVFVEGFEPLAEVLRNDHEAFAGRALPGPLDVEQIPALVERGGKRASEFFAMLDGELADRAWIAGNSVSLADIDAAVAMQFAARVKCEPPARRRNLHAWYGRAREQFGL